MDQAPDSNSPDHTLDDGERKKTDRRQVAAQVPPDGVERRQWRDRRRQRSMEGRERYLDMVQRERAMLMGLGVTRSTDQLLDLAGTPQATEEDAETKGMKDHANGDQLRQTLPVQSWLPLNIHLIGLHDGVLKIAPLNDLNQRQKDALISTANRTGLLVETIESEIWDRAEL
ncbi:MAG: type II/IV secretion system family protein, partial [Pseudomonadota bacterium]